MYTLNIRFLFILLVAMVFFVGVSTVVDAAKKTAVTQKDTVQVGRPSER